MNAFRNLISKTTVLAFVILGVFVMTYHGQVVPEGKDTGRGWCEYQGRVVPCPTGGGSGGGTTSGGSGGGAVGWLLCKTIGGFGCPKKTDTRKQDAYDLNQKGVEAFNNGELAAALSYFEQALKKDPSDPVIKQNLQNTRDAMAAKAAKEKYDRENEQAKLRDKAAADNMQRSIQDFAKTLSAAPSSGGLDFDGGSSSATPKSGSNGNGLDFTTGDTNVVVDPSVPSGIPKAVEDSINSVYRTSSPEVVQRVRRGFQAVMSHDWKLANAYFQDALNQDPNNRGLRKFVEIVGNPDGQSPPKIIQIPTGQSGKIQIPQKADAALLFDPKNKSEQLEMPTQADMDALFNDAPYRESQNIVDVAYALWKKVNVPLIFVTIGEGHLSIYPFDDNGLVLLPEGPFVIGNDGEPHLSKNHDDYVLWKQTYVRSALPLQKP